MCFCVWVISCDLFVVSADVDLCSHSHIHSVFTEIDMRLDHINRGEIMRCDADGCNGLIKPAIVFFG